MKFEWDDAKNEHNIAKHGIDFSDVKSMFMAPMLTRSDDRFDYGEDCWVSIGNIDPVTAVVVWTERRHGIVRIISARKANRYERAKYNAYIANQLGTPEPNE